jgi:hypothetical protein
VGVPRWFSRERADSERFAHAVDDRSGEEAAGFATELALLDHLRVLGEAGAPDAETRRRIHADIFERLAPADEEPDENDDNDDSGANVISLRRRHPVLAGALVAAVAALLVLGGLSLLLSKDALPGDALYGVKRAGESAELGLTFGQQAKGEKYLEFATNRIDELAQLSQKDAGSAAYVTGLADFDGDVSAGVAQLTSVATASGGDQQLTELRTWATQQSAKLDAEQAVIPPAAAAQFAQAQSLLGKIADRAASLAARLGCYLITSGLTDELGAIPAQGPCDAPAPTSAGGAPTTAPPTGGTVVPPPDPVVASQTTSQLSGTETALPTPPLPTATSGGSLPPPVVAPPILPPINPRPPTTSPRPPLISLPPLLPGLPPIVIG